jgi:IS30 family transposase
VGGFKTMSHYHHISINEREKILVLRAKEKSLHAISKEIGRSVSTISRELKRNATANKEYSAVEAQKKYQKRRKNCRRHKLLENMDLKNVVTRLFLEQQWSPEQISNRLLYEKNALKISYSSIYRAIYSGMLNSQEQSHGNRGVIKKLRHRGKTRHHKGTVETRGKIVISNRIQERPKEAEERKVIGHWELDTLIGKIGSACLVTIVERCTRYSLAEKIQKKYAFLVAKAIIAMLSGVPKEKLKSLTPDQGKEFSMHSFVTEALNGVQFYFSDPHSPWQRGTNENFNGLLREYLPKCFDIAQVSDVEVANFVKKLNFRPRKCLGWKTPHEAFFNQTLHLT